MSFQSWFIWALFLIAQNVSFTFVSRARNSASLARHMKAAAISNLVWFGSQVILLTDVLPMLKGEQGLLRAIGAGVFYTVFTMGGSAAAHWYALRTEKGKAAVGANKKYAQITVEEWQNVQDLLEVPTTDYVVIGTGDRRLGFKRGLLTTYEGHFGPDVPVSGAPALPRYRNKSFLERNSNND